MKISIKLALAVSAVVLGCQPLPWNSSDALAVSVQDAQKSTAMAASAPKGSEADVKRNQIVAAAIQTNPTPILSSSPGTIAFNDILKNSKFPDGFDTKVLSSTTRRLRVNVGVHNPNYAGHTFALDLDTGKILDYFGGSSTQQPTAMIVDVNNTKVYLTDLNVMLNTVNQRMTAMGLSPNTISRLKQIANVLNNVITVSRNILNPPVPAPKPVPGADPNRPSIKTKTVMRYCGEPGQEKPC